MECRRKFVDILRKKKHIKLTDEECKDLEIGIFNWAIDFSDKHQIIKNWDNKQFKKLYFIRYVLHARVENICISFEKKKCTYIHSLITIRIKFNSLWISIVFPLLEKSF